LKGQKHVTFLEELKTKFGIFIWTKIFNPQ